MFNIKIKEKIFMKKTYKIPTLKVVKTKGARLMQASAKMFGKNATSAGMGRRAEFSDWDEE